MRSGDYIARCGVEGDDSWTLTASGLKLVYLRPEVESICLDDIAQHLSMLCRFTGAVSQFYSVAQHSVFVGALVKQVLDDEGVDRGVDYWDQILAALLHDAEETYTNDLASPLKSCIRGKYKWIASGIERKVFERYGIDWDYRNALVKACDNKAIIVERFYFMPEHPDWPKVSVEEMEYPKPRLMEHDEAKLIFTNTVRAALKVRNALLAEVNGA
ncbi:MAG TPA: hypothetical protein ENH62_05865 [Marinobacter sp.]|uniref:HD/PDEase domain-containing protein n=1 Tax=marine sediment metagenome TaxID=412755 RepID=A0A0F9VRN2_9ZZZZ|nr:hypothetical protein [Marinobacter sp.]